MNNTSGTSPSASSVQAISAGPGQARAGRREWTALAILALPTLLVSMDATVTYLALPVISRVLKPGSVQLLWITDIYTFLEGGLLITMGTLGDRIGRRRLLLYGAVAFAIASALAAFSTGPGMLIAARGLLGIAGATLLPSILSLIRNMFHDDRQRTLAVGIFTTCFASGTMLGPLIGGVLLDHFWWGSVFLIGAPVMVLFLALGPTLLPEFREPRAGRFDLWGAALLLTGILAIVYGIKQVAQYGHAGWLSLLLIAAGIAVSSAFVRRQKKATEPLIDLSLFRKPVINATLAAFFLALFCWSGLYLFIAQYLQLVIGLDPLKAGLFTIPGAGAGMAGCMLAPLVLRWFRKTTTMVSGLLIMTAGMLALSQTGNNPGLSLLIIATVLITFGCSITVTVCHDMMAANVSAELSGAAAGVTESSATFGSAFGVALLGSIGAALYRSKMAGASLNGMAGDLTEKASNTLGGALAASKQLAGPHGAALFDDARTAFVHSLRLTAGIAAALMLMAAILISWTFSRAKQPSVR